VQVGDPFEEKKLIEACLELYEKDWWSGSRTSARQRVFPVPRPNRQVGPVWGWRSTSTGPHPGVRDDAPELLMSESQERMMAFVAPDKVAEVLAVADKWEIDSAVIGEVKARGDAHHHASG
jgi:phosphoribosylformylglycinamidine synthase subunit PurL